LDAITGATKMTDIVERLRKRAITWLSFGWGNNDIYDEAANEIERLREALKLERQLRDDALRAFNEARAALKERE